MRNNIASLDLIRIGLIFTVFMCHASYVLPEKIAYYAQGMTGYALELFFIISGFLSYYIYQSKDSFKTIPFIVKKIKNIYPLHFLCIFI